MKAILALLLWVGVAACAARRVEVVDSDTPATSEVSLRVTNNATQAVNVYVNSGGNDLFVGQVAANSTQLLPVSGVASGSVATLRARTADGSETYTRSNVTLSGSFDWQVP